MSNELPIGWYSDAEGKKRYWNGEVWSDFKFEGTTHPGAEPVGDSDGVNPQASKAPSAGVLQDPQASESSFVVPAQPAKGPGRRFWIVTAVVVVMLLLAGGGTWWKLSTDAHTAQVAAAEEAAEEKAEKERKDRVAKNKRAADSAERAQRADLVTALEASIVEDAKESVTDGLLDGPILSGMCTATGGGSTDDLTSLTGTFECIAVTEEDGDQYRGYSYSATIDWTDGSYSWRLGT